MLRMFDSEEGLVKWSEWVIAEWVFAAAGQMMGPLTICSEELFEEDRRDWLECKTAKLDPISL